MTEVAQAETTMLYRKPSTESDEGAVQEIWGKKLETRVVEASEVPSMLSEGWVQHPLDIGKKPEELAGFTRELGGQEALLREALDTEKALTAELLETNKKLAGDLKAAEELVAAESKEKEAALARIAELTKKKG